MNCPSCGHSNLPGSAFCDNCGFDLSQAAAPAPAPAYPVAPPYPAAAPAAPTAPAAGGATCPQCGMAVTPGAVFCDNCGAKLGAPAAQPAPPTTPAAWPQQPGPVAPPPYQVPPVAGAACPQCGQPLISGALFCDSCGASLAAQQPQPPAYPQPGPTPGYPPVQPPMPGMMRMRLVVVNSGVQMPLAGKPEFYIGREDPIGQFFPDADLTPHGGDAGGVSRRHAKIVVYGSQVLFEDLNSTNGSFVNKVRVQPGQPVPLTDGAEVRLGKVILTFHTS